MERGDSDVEDDDDVSMARIMIITIRLNLPPNITQ